MKCEHNTRDTTRRCSYNLMREDYDQDSEPPVLKLKRTKRANLIWGGGFSERNIGDWGRSRRNSGGGGTVHHGNFYSGGSDERQRTRMWAGRRGEQEWYGYHGKMCRIKSHGTSPVILPGWFGTSIKTHAKEEIKKITYLISQSVLKWK